MNKNLPPWLWALITVILVLIIGFIDWVTGYELNFFLSYFIPVSLAAWFIGLRTSVGVSFLCTIVWFGAELLSGHAHSFYFYFAWNTLVRLVSFLILAKAISKIRQLLDHQSKLAEDLQRSLAKFVTLYDATTSAVILMDETGFLDCNKATLKMFGCASREEFCSKHPADFSPPIQPSGADSLTLSSRHIDEVLQNGRTQFEWLHKRADSGDTFYADVLLVTMVLDGKTIIQALVRDITAHKQAEDALRQSEAKFREVYESLDDLYFETDAEGMIRLLSPSVYQLTGYREEDLIGKPDTIVYVHPEENAWLRNRILQDGSVNDYEILLKKKNEDVAYASLTAHLSLNEKGQTIGIRGLLRNITARKQAEKALQESEIKYRRITENMSGIIAEIDAAGTIKYLSPSHSRIFGENPESLIGHTVFDHIHPEDRDRVMSELTEGVRLKTSREAEYRYRHADGHYIWVHSASNPIYSAAGELLGAVINTSVITERKKAEEALRQSEAKFRTVYENIDDLYFETDSEGNISLLSPSVGRLTGYKEADLIGKPYTSVYAQPEEREQLSDKMSQSGHVNDYEVLLQQKDGEVFFASLTARRFYDEKGRFTGVRGLLRNITERKTAEEQIRHMATHDGLTDLPTLKLASDRLAMAITAARRDQTTGAVMFMDLDGFKKVNDTLGHDAGDYVLKQVARRLLSCVRETDTVARLGGDEFLLIATRLNAPKNASLPAEKIVKSISEPFIFNGQPAKIGISIGIALFPNDGDSPEQLIKKADEAMYRIKNSGKNGYLFASEPE